MRAEQSVLFRQIREAGSQHAAVRSPLGVGLGAWGWAEAPKLRLDPACSLKGMREWIPRGPPPVAGGGILKEINHTGALTPALDWADGASPTPAQPSA